MVGDVGGVDPAGVGDDDAATRALVEVDRVDARGRGHHAAEGGCGVEERGVHPAGATPNDHRGTGGVRHGSGEEGREGLAGRKEVRGRGSAGAARRRRTRPRDG
ncbi:unnamed protein product [Urochloa humidicola]